MEIHTLPYIVALQAFCIVDPTLCIPVTDPSKFVVTLQPYLNIQVSMVYFDYYVILPLFCHLEHLTGTKTVLMTKLDENMHTFQS